MRKLSFIFASLFILLSAACSADGPDITSASLSDRSPVTEQKIVLGVTCLTNNPPMTYTWNSDGPDSYFQDSYGNAITPGTATSLYGVYWVAPQTPGTYTVTCTVGDQLDKTETAYFLINVSARGITQLMNASPATADYISYDVNTLSGGIFAVVSNDRNSDGTASNSVKMFTSVMFKVDMGWGSTYPLEAIYPIYYSILYATSYAIWGGYMNGTNLSLVDHSSSADDLIYTTATSTANDSVNSITLINSNIWVSADSGLWKFDTISAYFTNTLAYESYNADNSSSLSSVATSMGVYYSTTGDMTWQHLPSDAGTKALSVVSESSPLNIFALLGNGKFMQYSKPDGVTWSSSDITPTDPDIDISSVSKISKDPKGRIWVGKYRYNPASADGENPWYDPELDPNTQGAFPAGLDFDYTIVSAEGLVYFRTKDGQLWVWGKTPAPFYPAATE